MKCPVCNSNAFRVSFTVERDDPYRKIAGKEAPAAQYHECAGCGAMIFEGAAGFESAYSEGLYYEVAGDAESFLRERFHQIQKLPEQASDNRARVSRIKKFLLKRGIDFSASPLVCDVGAGMGVFLDAFLESNMSGIAIEPDPNAARHLRSVLTDCSVLEGFSEEFTFERPCDLITYNRVLEHIAQPVKALEWEQAHLAADGYLYIEVPHTSSYFQDGPNNEAFGYGHYMVYSAPALSLVTWRAGFEVVHMNSCVEPSGKFTLYAFCKAYRQRSSTDAG